MYRPSLNEITAFCVVAEHRSFRRAADDLGVTPSTLSHTLKGLEAGLQLRLLNRTTRSVSLTEAGTELLGRMLPLLTDYDAALADMRLHHDAPSGRLRISAAAAAVQPLLDRVLPTFSARYPEVEIEFAIDGRLLDIVEQGFDAGIRLGETVPRDMIGVPFGSPSRFVVVGSPAYLEGRGTPRTPNDIRHHLCVRMRLATGRLLRWRFAHGTRETTVEAGPGLIVNDVPVQVQAAVHGLGLAYVWEEVAKPLIADGTLRVVLEAWALPASRLLLYYPGARRPAPALKAFVDVLRNAGD